MKKYELVSTDTIVVGGATLTRIRALIDIVSDARASFAVKAGDLGGYVQSADNLSQDGMCWVGPNAKVYGKSRVTDNAVAWFEGEVCQRARIYGNAVVAGKVRGNAQVGGIQVVDKIVVVEGITHLK